MSKTFLFALISLIFQFERKILNESAVIQAFLVAIKTISIHTASAEREFSRMKIIKNKLRTIQTDERMKSLMKISAEKDIMNSILSEEKELRNLVFLFNKKKNRELEFGFLNFNE